MTLHALNIEVISFKCSTHFGGVVRSVGPKLWEKQPVTEQTPRVVCTERIAHIAHCSVFCCYNDNNDSDSVDTFQTHCDSHQEH